MAGYGHRHPAFARILVVPASRHDLGPFYHDVIAADPLEPYGAASAAYRLQVLARTLPFSVSGARLVPSNNNDVWRLEAGYLRVAWRGTGAAWPGRRSPMGGLLPRAGSTAIESNRVRRVARRKDSTCHNVTCHDFFGTWRVARPDGLMPCPAPVDVLRHLFGHEL